MANPTLKLVAGNTAPPWQLTCTRNGVAIDLTGCSVVIIISNGTSLTQANGSCTIINNTGGIIQYKPLSTDCPTVGTYKADIKVTYSDGTVERLYDQLKIKARAALS